MIAQTYVQIARMSWSHFESALEGYPKDRHVWHYVKGVLQPLVLSLKDKIFVDPSQQEKHEEAVERFVANMDAGKSFRNKTKGYVQLKRRDTKKWRSIERIIFMKGFFVVRSYLEEVWEVIKLMKMLSIILLVPLMFCINTSSKYYTVTLGVLTLIGFTVTYTDWHRPYWRADTGIIVTAPPMIFRNWLKTWALQDFLMKFPFDLFLITVSSPRILNGVRLMRLLHCAKLMTKLAREKAKRSLRFGLVMQVQIIFMPLPELFSMQL